MRFLFWSENYLPLIGGAEILIRNLSRALVRRGHQCHLITSHLHPSHPATDDDQGVTVHRLPLLAATARQDLKALVQSRRAIQEVRAHLQPDVEHVYFNGPILRIQQMPSPAVAPKLVVTLPLLFEQVSGSPTIQQLLKDSRARLIMLSRLGLEFLRTHAPSLAPQLGCITATAPSPTITPSALPTRPPVFFGHGRLVHEKGFDIALQAFARLASHPSNPQLIIAGDGPERPHLEALTASLGLSNRVRFTGWIAPDDIPGSLNDASIVLTPSRWKEPFGLVALEAAQMGRPVIASNTGGLPDIVQDSITGRLVPPEDPAALADAMADLLSDLPRLQQMGQHARVRALSEFDFDRSIDKHLELYGS
jgi:glycogen(starch) synthase